MAIRIESAILVQGKRVGDDLHIGSKEVDTVPVPTHYRDQMQEHGLAKFDAPLPPYMAIMLTLAGGSVGETFNFSSYFISPDQEKVRTKVQHEVVTGQYSFKLILNGKEGLKIPLLACWADEVPHPP